MDELLIKLEHYSTMLGSSAPNKTEKKAPQKVAAPTKKVKKDIKPVEKLDRPQVKPLKSNGEFHPEKISKEKFYITTAINYTNGLPHLGHAYEGITTDIISRYQKIAGRDTFFLTGTDEHGQKVENSAIAAGKTPQDIADFYAGKFKELNKKLLVESDHFIRTTDADHEENCKILWNKVMDKGDIYLKDYVGWYDVHNEKYVTDHEAEASDFKDEHGRPYEKKSEESYFFKMSKYQDQLKKHIDDNPNFVQPASRKNEILSFLKEDLLDLCISRTVCQWGVKSPFDPNYKGDKSHVMYVWFDALTNYLSGVEFLSNPSGEKAKYWPANTHIIGKDIIRFHCVIWPCMLLAADIPLPESVFAHGFVKDKEGIKMSKSLGNVIDPWDIVTKYDADAFRYYLAQETSYGSDMAFNEEALVSQFNSTLCSGFGNFVHRSTSLCKGYCDGKVPAEEPYALNGQLPFDVSKLFNDFETHISVAGGYQLQSACESLIVAINSANKFLQDCAPWNLKGDEFAVQRRAIVRSALESVYILAHFIFPLCPQKMPEVFDKLGVEMTQVSKLNSNFKNLPPGTTTYVGDVLYNQLEFVPSGEVKKTEEKPKEESKKKEPVAKKGGQGEVKGLKLAENDELFYQIDIRVGKIVDVWHHPDADGLFCEKIDVGESEPREIASGLRAHYTLEDLKDRKILAICNLKPANLKGFKSHGMVLCACVKAADGSEKVEFCEPPAGSEVGERIILSSTTLASGETIDIDLADESISKTLEPANPNAVSKKKIFVKMAENLRTNDSCEAEFAGKKLVTGKTKGVCRGKTLQQAILR